MQKWTFKKVSNTANLWKNLTLTLIIFLAVVVLWSNLLNNFYDCCSGLNILYTYLKFHHNTSEVDFVITLVVFTWKAGYLNYLSRNGHSCVLFLGVPVMFKFLVTFSLCFKNNKFILGHCYWYLSEFSRIFCFIYTLIAI